MKTKLIYFFVAAFFTGLAVFKLFDQPWKIIVAMAPLMALVLFLLTADKIGQPGMIGKALKKVPLSDAVTRAHTASVSGSMNTIPAMLLKAGIVLVMFVWFIAVLIFWPA